jgi:Flp pilus assembly protein TadG
MVAGFLREIRHHSISVGLPPKQQTKESIPVISVANIKNRSAGQAMVELAIVLPVLLMLVLGIIQFGILFNNYQTLTDAVRAGARQAAVSRTLPNPAGSAEARVRSAASGSLSDAGDPAILVVTVTSAFAQGSDVTVKATYPYSLKLFGVPVKNGRLISETTERVE